MYRTKSINQRVSMTRIIALAIFVAALFGCASPNDNAKSAQEVAERWVAKNIDQIAAPMASAITKDYSAFAKPIIAAAMREQRAMRLENAAACNASNASGVVGMSDSFYDGCNEWINFNDTFTS